MESNKTWMIFSVEKALELAEFSILSTQRRRLAAFSQQTYFSSSRVSFIRGNSTMNQNKNC